MNLKKAEKLIRQRISRDVMEIAEKFFQNGFSLYLVGGFIRDLLLDRDVSRKEYDLATNALPEQVIKIFKRVIPTGLKHGTVSILKDQQVFEVTTFRADGNYSDGRRPDQVFYAETIEDDLLRRDFTINAFAFDLKKLKLIDNFNGLQDLKKGIIRTIGDPDKRFQEDGLRLIRAVRFSTVLNFVIEENTYRSINKNLFMIEKIAWERIRDEFEKIILSSKPSTGIDLLRKTGLLLKIIPEMLTGYGIMQNKFHKYDVYHHLLYTCDAVVQDNLCVRLAALFHDISKPFTKSAQEGEENSTFYNHEVVSAIVSKKILKRLRFSNQVIDRVEKLVKFHMFYYTEDWTDSAVRRFLRKVGYELLDDLFALREADRLGNGTKQERSRHLIELKARIQKVIDAENAFSIKHLKVDGHDVMTIRNLRSSPDVGRILNYLLEKVLDDPSLNEKDKLEKMIREYKN